VVYLLPLVTVNIANLKKTVGAKYCSYVISLCSNCKSNQKKKKKKINAAIHKMQNSKNNDLGKHKIRKNVKI